MYVDILRNCQSVFKAVILCNQGFLVGSGDKESTCQCRKCRRPGFNPCIGKIPWKKAWPPTPVFMPGESHGQRSLMGYGPCSYKELDTTEATQHSVTSCTQSFLVAQRKESPVNAGDARDMGSVSGSGRSPGGGNGNPLQYSCQDRGAWYATVHGVVKSQIPLSQTLPP